MNNNPIPEDVRDFLLEHIDSVAQLEALLLLRHHSSESWDVLRLAQRLYIEESDARTILSALAAAAFVTTDGSTFRFGPEEEKTRALIESVADHYARFLVPVTRIIHEKAASVRQFANAFKFRKDK